MWEARKSWGAIVNASRAWGMMINDYVTNDHATIGLSEGELQFEKMRFINRHFAWLTALRFQLREPRAWEAIYKKHNQEYKNKWFRVSEQNEKLENALKKYLTDEELRLVLSKTNKAAQVLSLQSSALRELRTKGLIDDFRHMEMEKMIVEFLNQQGACERIKNFPYPRQYATLNMYFIKIFVILVPLGMLKEFNSLGENMVWLAIPFSALSTWIFTTMEKIGESTESPFEGSANDVPISAMSRAIEIDLREMFNDRDIPAPIKSENNILV
jgi:putative membrane protein